MRNLFLVGAAGVALGVVVVATPTTVAPRFCVVPATVRLLRNATCDDVAFAATAIDLAGALGEAEHVQVLVEAAAGANSEDKAAENSAVAVDLTSAPGEASWWTVWQVGYVMVNETTRYEPSGGGWSADPLLAADADNTVPLDPDASTVLWLRVSIPRDAKPGTFDGALGVSIFPVNDDVELQSSGVKRDDATTPNVGTVAARVEVWAFPSPTLALSAWTKVFNAGGADNRSAAAMAQIYQGHEGGYSSEMQKAYYDLLTEHLIPPDDAYLNSPRPVSDYEYLHSVGQPLMGLLDVSTLPFEGGDGCANFSDAYVANMLDALRPAVDMNDAAGIPRNATYVYGFDEASPSCEPGVRRLFGAVKDAFPGVRTVAVLNWPQDTGENMPDDLPLDVWVLQYEEHDDAAADAWLSSRGNSDDDSSPTTTPAREYWLYHCIEPSGSEYLNTFIERPLIQARLLFWYGASLPQVNGWLYYAVDLWDTGCAANPDPHEAPMARLASDSALTTWNAGNCIWYPTYDFWANGDGQYIYPGPDGPIPTVRLANIRDGLEDVDLFRALPPATASDLLARLVRSPTNFTEDPALLEATRRDAAAALAALRTPPMTLLDNNDSDAASDSAPVLAAMS